MDKNLRLQIRLNQINAYDALFFKYDNIILY
jgi:hypothetical protein